MKNNMNKIYLIGGIVLSVFMSVLIIIGSYKDKQKAETSEAIAEEAPADPVADFEEKAKETLDLYDGIQYSVNKWTVTIVVDLDKWNATSEADRKAFMNEIYALLNVDAHTSGIVSDHKVSVTFMTSDRNNVTVYRIEKE